MTNVIANPDPFLSAKAAARYLGLDATVKWPEQSMRALARKGRIQSSRMAGKLMFRVSWLEAFVQASKTNPD